MAKQNIPEQPRVQTTQYANLLGVDYQSDETEVARNRSPEMVNMISDLGGNPKKRFGYRRVGDAYIGTASANGENYAVKMVDGKIYVAMISISDEGNISEAELTKVSDDIDYGTINRVFGFKNLIYILCSNEWFEYDPKRKTSIAVRTDTNSILNNIPNDKLIPTVMTLYKPSGNEMITLPEGTSLVGATQGVNLLTPWRRIEYCVQIDTKDETSFYIPMQAKMSPKVKVEVLDSNTFEWKETLTYNTQGSTSIKVVENDGVTTQNITVVDARVNFSASPYTTNTIGGTTRLVFKDNTSKVVPAGVPNVRITFAPVNMASASTLEEVVEATAYSVTQPDYIIATLYVQPYSYVTVHAILDGTATDISLTPNTASTQTVNGWLVIYDGNKTIKLGKPSEWNVCNTTNYCGESNYVAAPTLNGSVAGINYNAKVSSADGYLGYFRIDRKRLLETQATAIHDSRFFAAAEARTYYSRPDSPFKIDDNFYFDVDSDIVLYNKISSNLIIITEDDGNNTIYLASGDYDSDLAMQAYSIKASNSAVGSIAPNVGGVFNDEPLFLSSRGVFGITSNYYSDKYATMRSGKINRRLTKMSGLTSAVGKAHNDYYYLAIGNEMYVLDGRHKDASKNGDNSYECYYFNNMPNITRIFVANNRLFFSDDEQTYTFNDNLPEKAQYLDNAVFDGDIWTGEPVKAKWTSLLDDDGAPQYYKVLQKKGTMVTVAPPMQTSCQVTIIKDAHDHIYVGRFSGATFALSDSVLDGFTKKKVKKYKRLQFVVENNEAEPFGIILLVKSYTLGNYAKR